MPFISTVKQVAILKADPEWERAKRATNRFTGGVSGAFIGLVERFREALTEEKIYQFLSRGDVPGLLLEISEIQWRSIKIEKRELTVEELMPLVTRAAVGSFEDVIAGYYLEIITAEAERELKRLGYGVRFNLDNPYSVPWVREHVAKLVVQVSDETKKAVRTIIEQSFTEGIPPREAARAIRKIVGLTERQAVAVQNRRNFLMIGGESGDRLERLTDAYSKRLLRLRSENIARTEVISAHSHGIQDSWRVARDGGFLDPGSKRVWIAATESDRTCDQCLAMDGQLAEVEGNFNSDLGEVAFLPPLHPGCRCSMGIVAV